MGVPLVRLCAVLLLSSVPMVCGENKGENNFGGDSKVGDMATDESENVNIEIRVQPSDNFRMTDPSFNDPRIEEGPNDDDISSQLNSIDWKTEDILELLDSEQRSHSNFHDDVMTKFRNIEESIQSIDKLVMNQYQAITKLLSAIESEQKNRDMYGCNSELNDGKSNQCLVEIFKFVKEIQGQMCDKFCRRGQGVSNENLNPILIDSNNVRNNYNNNRRRMMNKRRNTPDTQINERSHRLYRNVKRTTNPLVFSEPNKKNCHEIRNRRNGIYKFASPDEVSNEAGRFFYERYCDFDTVGAAWTVIQRRHINNEQEREKFNRKCLDYKLGFGDLDKEFWFGNDFIHNLTSDCDMELRIVVEDSSGNDYWAEYSLFKVGSEEFNYNLTIGDYRIGSIPQEFLHLNQNNEYWPSYAPSDANGWWLNNCTDASNRDYKGIVWRSCLRSKCLTLTKMMVRPTNIE